MLDYIKRLITPDMVSLWVPSGLNRAQDLIRGNHGQCYGTHPNVPVQPSLINPSVGWYFDGVDDYVSVPHSGSLNIIGAFTIAGWFNHDTGLGEEADGFYGGILKDTNYGLGWQGYTDGWSVEFYSAAVRKVLDTTDSYMPAGEWHHIAGVYDPPHLRIYRDGVEVNSNNVGVFVLDTNINSLEIGRRGLAYWHGHIALPFIAKSAWSIAQIGNFYNATKGMFAPRG